LRPLVLGIAFGLLACEPKRGAPANASNSTVGLAPPEFPHASDSILLRGHSGDPSHWPMYGGDYSQRRYSPLDQINTGNVARLRPAWIYQSGYAESFQTTPVVVGREMYLTIPMVEQTQRVVKLDAATGRKLWETPIRQGTTLFCCGPNNRGVAVSGERVFLATLDARLLALDARTGAVRWETRIAEPNMGYGNTSAPVAWDGKVFIGTSGGEWATRGFLKAFDQATGSLRWTWYTIPAPEDGGWWGDWVERAPGTNLSLNRNIQREKADSAKYADAWKRGGGPIWMPASLDPALGLLFVAVGNANPDYNGVSRPGDNRWTGSVCAIHAADGKQAWCFQFVPHDVWDYDGTSPPFLFELSKDGARLPAVGLFTKVGWLYVLDRRNGRLITRSDNYVPQQNLFRVPGRDTVVIAPGSAGGTNWSPGAYHPGTMLAYSANIDWPMGTLGVNQLPCQPGPKECIGSDVAMGPGQGPSPKGNLAAVDPATGKVAWHASTRLPLIGGVLVTAGDLLFAGQSDGSFDAWDARTGEHLWRFGTGAGCNAAPMTYRLGSQQYVAIACGGSFILRRSGIESPAGDAVIAFALP